MTNIEQLIEKYEDKFPVDYNNKSGVLLNLIIEDLKSIEQPDVDLGFLKSLINGICGDYFYSNNLNEENLRIILEKRLNHLTSKAPKQEVKVDKVVERFKDNGSMYYDNMWE